MSNAPIRKPILVDWYERYLDSLNLHQFVSSVSGLYSLGTLERLADHGEHLVRRAAIFALGLIGDYSVNQVLGRALQDDDRTVRLVAERGCRFIWNRWGTPRQRQLLATVVRLNAAGRYRDALERVAQLLDEAPGFAEAWYQRGTACFELNQYYEALRNWHQTLELNPYHYIAASGMGHAFLRVGDSASALEAFRRALRLYPEQDQVRRQIEQLSDHTD